MSRLYIDLETRSGQDIRKVSPYRYVEDKDFRILIACWAWEDGPVQTALAASEIDELWWMVQAAGYVKVAHNVTFERCALGAHFGEYLPPEQWDDTMARAGEWGYPQSLEALARALGGEQKDTAGTRLINLFSKPQRDGKFTRPEDKPEQWQQFIDYCAQDVETLRDVDQRLPGWPGDEREVWLADQRINDHGFRIDLDLALKAIEAAEENRELQELEVRALTGIANPNSTQQLHPWLKAHCQALVPNLKAQTIEKALAQEPPGVPRRVLELRQELAMTAYKKYTAAVANVCQDGRVHGAFKFFGAHTGRWSGKGLQPQNLPREQLADEDATDLAILDLLLDNGADAITLKALVRSAMVGPFTICDYSAIEARVIAWLSGEQWTLDAFEDGRDIYVETAERMGGLTRSQGKVAVLALGYNGGINSLRVMGAQGSDEELQALVNAWRSTNRKIVGFWKELENAFKTGGKAGRLLVERDGKDRAIVLPSGRAITYHKCALKASVKNPDRRVLSFANPTGVGRTETYGGRLAENATQAVARDILAAALVRLQKHGYVPVAHVHDEAIIEGVYPVTEISNIMCERPDWAEDLPLAAEGFVARRYRKG